MTGEKGSEAKRKEKGAWVEKKVSGKISSPPANFVMTGTGGLKGFFGRS